MVINYQLGQISLAPFLFGYARSIIFLRREEGRRRRVLYISIIYSSFGFGRERPERPKTPSPGQAKRHPGYRVLKQLRPVRAKALPLTDRVLKIGINHCYCCPMRISKARLMLLPFQGATALTRKPQGVASLALGYVHHWAFSPSLLNPKLQLYI